MTFTNKQNPAEMRPTILIAGATPSLGLILLDVMMPGLDGYETCRRLKANPATAGIPPILFARVASQLNLRAARRSLQEHNENLEKLVQERTAQLYLMQEAIIVAMASFAETRAQGRDGMRGKHIRRTQNYVRALATHPQSHPRFAAELTDEYIELLYRSAPLHDIGKVGIPDRILLKPGKLDREEFEVMKMHAVGRPGLPAEPGGRTDPAVGPPDGGARRAVLPARRQMIYIVLFV